MKNQNTAQPETAPATAHTPFPWQVVPTHGNMRDNYKQPYALAQAGTPNLIAGFFGDVRGGPEVAKANADLVNSIPALISERDRLRNALEQIQAMTKAPQPMMNSIQLVTVNALAGIGSSESTRLREITAALVGTLGNVRAFMSSGIPSSDESELLDEIEAALKKAKDAQGGLSA